MYRMRVTLLLAATLAVAVSAAAFAQPPHPMPPAMPSWTGAYVGLNIGGSFGHSRSDYSTTSSNGSESTSDSVNINGMIVGAQAGYNYQFSQNYVAGIEADFQGSNEQGDDNPLVCHNPFACDFGNINDAYTEQLQWFGTVRGRLGYLVTPSVLLYGTGGLAYGELRRDDDYIYSSFLFCNSPPAGAGACTPQGNSTRGVQLGWTAGGGVETKLWGNWSGRIEYLYMQLAGLGTSTVALTSGNPTPIFVTTTSHTFTDNIVRIAVSYNFP